VIQISRIAATTPDEVQEAILDLQEQGAELFVLDLRGNPGGLLDAGVNTARLFLESGIVIEEQYKDQPIRAYEVEEVGEFSDLPLAVIIDQGTASAAELIAWALKAQGRARIYGQRSYGKDSLQLIFELRDDSSLHVTAAKWWVPGLEPPLGGNGVQPDVLVTADGQQLKPEIRAIIDTLLPGP
jgi:carboxyl-terminal processing protease